MERVNPVYDGDGSLESDQPARPRKRRVWIWIVAAVLVLALLTAAAFLLLPRLLGGGSAEAAWPYRNAYINADKSAAYFLLPRGKSVKVQDDGKTSQRIAGDLRYPW